MAKHVSRIMQAGAMLLVVLSGVGCSGKKELSVTGISPNKGPFTGGDPVIISGSGFQTPSPKGLTVYFGKRKAPNAIIMSDTQVRVEPPGGEDGVTVDVEIVFDDSRQGKLAKAYSYYDPAGTRLEVGDIAGKDK